MVFQENLLNALSRLPRPAMAMTFLILVRRREQK
jgi:hypothetical protein